VLDADLPSVVAHPDVQTKDGECILPMSVVGEDQLAACFATNANTRH
jgi:hypothetical protein